MDIPMWKSISTRCVNDDISNGLTSYGDIFQASFDDVDTSMVIASFWVPSDNPYSMTSETEFTLIGDKDTDEHFYMHSQPPENGKLKLVVESSWAEDNQATFMLWLRGQQNNGDDFSMNFSKSEDYVVFQVDAEDDTPFEYAKRVCPFYFIAIDNR